MKTYMTTAELAEHLTVSVTKLKEMVREGAIPTDTFFRHGRTCRFNVELVEQHLLKTEKSGQIELDPDTDYSARS